MPKSLLIRRKSVCYVDGTNSDLSETICGPYQGCPPASTIWCVYINLLLCHIEKKINFKNNCNQIIGKIEPYAYSADINIITSILRRYGTKYSNGQQFTNIQISVQQQVISKMQQTIDAITEHLSIKNIPQNEDKTKILIVHEYGYQPLSNNASNKSPVPDIRKWMLSPPTQSTPSSPSDTFSVLRNANFTVIGNIQKKVPILKNLVIHLDNKWSCAFQTQCLANKMRMIRIKCIKLMQYLAQSTN